MSESFESAMTLARMIMAEGDMPLLDRLQDAHDHELEQMRKARFHEGYVAGQHSMDAEHYAVALRLRALPLDGDTQENLSQIARAVWHSDFGWTHGACRALRDELVRLMGGVSERQYPTSTYDVLGNERHKAVCRLREWEPDEDGMPHRELWEAVMGKKLPTVPLKGDAELDIIMRDRLINLLGGDDGTCLNDGPTSSITNELRECIETARKSHDHCISEAELLEIADRIDEQFNRICWQHEAVLQSTIADLTAERDELQEKLDEMREHRDHWASEATKMYRLFFPHEEYCMPNEPSEMVVHKINELQAKLDEAEFAIANWREREKSFDASERLSEELRQERDELRERLDRVADALRGVERGTMSAWEAADEVGR